MRLATKNFRLNRVLSTPLTAVLLKTPLTPNQVTGLSLAFGIAAGFLFSRGSYLFCLSGALSYELACVLDNCDGEIARAKKQHSVLGGWLDIVADFVTDISLFTGIAIGIGKQAHPLPVVIFFSLCLSGAFIHFCLVIIEKKKGFGPAAFNSPNPEPLHRSNVLFKIFDALREGDASWLVLVLALAGQTAYLLWLGAFYMQILWISALFLNFRFLVTCQNQTR